MEKPLTERPQHPQVKAWLQKIAVDAMVGVKNFGKEEVKQALADLSFELFKFRASLDVEEAEEEEVTQ